jgi:hypothetical protein
MTPTREREEEYTTHGAVPGATKLIAKRRIDALDGNIASYSRLLNSDAHLEQIKEVNALTAAVAEVTRDEDDERKRKKDAAAVQALRSSRMHRRSTSVGSDGMSRSIDGEV